MLQLAEVMRIKAKRSNLQIFVSSHSPEFISALDLDEVFYVSMENETTQIKRLSPSKELSARFKDTPLGEILTSGTITLLQQK